MYNTTWRLSIEIWAYRIPAAVDASDEESVGSEIPYNKKSQAEKTEAEGQLDEELQDNVKAEGQEEEEYEEGDEDSEGEGMYAERFRHCRLTQLIMGCF